jgi:hypothetical protein
MIAVNCVKKKLRFRFNTLSKFNRHCLQSIINRHLCYISTYLRSAPKTKVDNTMVYGLNMPCIAKN